MTKILLTGANGFLGKCIVKNLENNFQISSLSRKLGDYKISLETTVPQFNHKFDLVIHAAGKAHTVPKKETEKKKFYDVNVTGTQNLLNGLEIIGVPNQFVFISSVSVYGKESGLNISEDQSLEAKDAYGLSKIRAELLVLEWCEKNNVVCTILRLPLLVGKNPPGNLGAMIKAIVKGYYFNIGGGKAKKSMVLAEDVAVFIPTLAKVGGIYNLTDGVHPDFKSLSLVIAKQNNKSKLLNLPIFVAKVFGNIGNIIGNSAPINSLKLKKITSDLTFDDTRARQIGWKPKEVLDYLQTNDI
ncbi:NAD-dependent epimerase/dehydratase family protein [Flavobacterium sp.]|jgi:nucleoside-diphosphate-sugar epimerase|uniref:NAD-dependent epimerase/dehydratase family protein n=1 Tax=Flavobacterium sp. TaxID=239 RepID=UPI0037BF558E